MEVFSSWLGLVREGEAERGGQKLLLWSQDSLGHHLARLAGMVLGVQFWWYILPVDPLPRHLLQIQVALFVEQDVSPADRTWIRSPRSR